MRWSLADVLGLFSINVGPFSINVVPSVRMFSINPVPKTRMFSVPAIYVLGPLQVGMDRPTLFKNIRSITQGFTWTVIDGSPRIEELAVAALKVADLVLIPVQPSPYDIWAAESLAELVKARLEVMEGKLKAAFMVSRQIVGTKLAGEIRAALEGYGLPLLDAFTSQRVIYANSAAQGSTVLDDEPQGAAANEVRALVDEVLVWR